MWSGRLGWSRRVTDELFHIILDDIRERAPLDRLNERLRADGTLSETSKRERSTSEYQYEGKQGNISKPSADTHRVAQRDALGG